MYIKKLIAPAAFSLGVAFASSMPANAADLLSGYVQVQSAYPDINTIDPSYTSSGPTSQTLNTLYGWYFTFTSDTITWYNPYPGQRPDVSFNGWILDFNGIPEISNVVIDPQSQITGSSVIFTKNSVAINTVDVYLPAGNEVFDVTFSSNTAAVPEPAAWGMMLMGFGIIGLIMRKRTNIQTKVNCA